MPDFFKKIFANPENRMGRRFLSLPVNHSCG
jgi:hypothetical protein